MSKLWQFGDYVSHLNHENLIVRRWAFDALENRFSNQYADEVSSLLNDDDEYMVCDALRYLARHQAVAHAPAILKLFQSRHGIVSSNSAESLAKMHYAPAMDIMLERFISPGNEEIFLGLLQYHGAMRHDRSRDALLSVINQQEEPLILGEVLPALLSHYYPEDVKLAMDIYFDPDNRNDILLKNILSPAGADSYFDDFWKCDENILSKPSETFKDLLLHNLHIQMDQSLLDRLIQSIDHKQYENFITILIFEARSIIRKRYTDDNKIKNAKSLYEQDKLCLGILEDLSKRFAIIKEIIALASEGPDIIAFVISIYLGIIERGAYINAFLPDAGKEDLIYALENAGSFFPEKIQAKIKTQLPVSGIKKVLKKNIFTWGAIWAVRMMGQIGDKAFVPDLIYVLSESDSVDPVYGDANKALNALDESADELILSAIEKNELGDWSAFAALEHLPYSEAYDLAVKLWDDKSADAMNSYEMFAYYLKGIGDKRGIEKLQDIYANESDIMPVGDALECLSEIYQVDIPELQEIRKKRKERAEKQKQGGLNALLRHYGILKDDDQISEKTATKIPFKKESPKIGRNAPCPCGSGKKYKKCCLKNVKS